MASNRTQQLKTTTVDLSGLPEPVVEQVLRLVHDARQKQAEAGALRSPNQDDPERWSAEWRAWTASHEKRDITLDDDRESIYAGCGE
jgi:hypothetical protein